MFFHSIFLTSVLVAKIPPLQGGVPHLIKVPITPLLILTKHLITKNRKKMTKKMQKLQKSSKNGLKTGIFPSVHAKLHTLFYPKMAFFALFSGPTPLIKPLIKPSPTP